MEELGLGKCWHGFNILEEPEIIDQLTAAVADEALDYYKLFDADVRSVVDFCGMLFYEANPSSKVVLTDRDEDEWYSSVYDALWTYARREDSFPKLGHRAVPAKDAYIPGPARGEGACVGCIPDPYR